MYMPYTPCHHLVADSTVQDEQIATLKKSVQWEATPSVLTNPVLNSNRITAAGSEIKSEGHRQNLNQEELIRLLLQTIREVPENPLATSGNSVPEVANEKKEPAKKPRTESSDSPKEKMKSQMKLDRYNGKTSVEVFLKKFEVCSKNNGWTEEEKLAQLTCALIEPVDQLLHEFDSEALVTSADLVSRLKLRYGSNDQAALYQTKLNTRRQKVGEDLGSLVQDIRKLMILAFPGPTSTHSETIAIRAFLDALRDKDLALKVREREPTTLDNAYKIAMRLEGYRWADEDGIDRRDRRPGRISNVKETEPDLDEKLNRLQEQMTRKMEEMLQKWSPQSSAASAEKQFRQWQPPRQTPTEANNNFGNQQWNRRPNNNFQRGTRDDRRCYECNQPGHLSRVCPGRVVNTSRREQEQREEQELNEVNNARHVKGRNDAYLSVTVKGKHLLGLLDSGCEMTLCPASLVDPAEIQNSKQSLLAANGSAIRVLGEAKLKLQIEGRPFEIPCLVTEQVSELILGLSWMKDENVLWHVGHNWILVGEHKFSVHCKPRSRLCRRIVVPRDTLAASDGEKEKRKLERIHLQDDVEKQPKPATPETSPPTESPSRFSAAKVVAQHQRDWDVHPPFVLAAPKASESESTGVIQNHLPISLVLEDMQSADVLLNKDDFVAVPIKHVQNNCEFARRFIQRSSPTRNHGNGPGYRQ
jgi:hypothetical protein